MIAWAGRYRAKDEGTSQSNWWDPHPRLSVGIMPLAWILSPAFLTSSMIPRGTAMTTVFDAEGPSPSMVCRVRSCITPGLVFMVAAAAARFSAAMRSPSALVMVARFSRSAAAWRYMIFLGSSLQEAPHLF